jgi:aerobic-type carbon monoxide dehydrogenase small subunit (CoxS/CutS family)
LICWIFSAIFKSKTAKINSAPRQLNVPPMKRLLDVLREDLRLTGSKEGCGASWGCRNRVNKVCKIRKFCYIQA